MENNQDKSPTDIAWDEVGGHRIADFCEDDAAKWASAFCYFARLNGYKIDEGWMITWFANAIEGAEIARDRRRQPQTLPPINYLKLVKPDSDEA